ncbi:MAG: LacI family DNA-binding transcriptional regulator [Oscillospiraceae bacterium]
MDNITIKDIANEAGVSTTTVSRVLNGSELVLPETRARVQKIISNKNYTPSATARNLSRSTSDAIGFIVPEVDNPFFGEILRTVIKTADQKNLTLICCNTDDDMTKDFRALAVMKEQRVRGLIYTPAVDYNRKKEGERVLEVLRGLKAPVVFLDRQIEDADFDGVFFDDFKGMYDATKTLIDMGHKRIAIINATLERPLALIRYNGYIRALKDAGIEPNAAYNFKANYRMTKSYELSMDMFEMKNRPTAVITCNNRTTMGFYKAAKEKKIEVQKDIACIALDRIEEFEALGMEMNFIERDVLKMGQQAINLLLERMANPDLPVRNVILEAKVNMNALRK